jgi:actin-related protein
VQAVVADVGSYATKIGWAGDDYLRSYFRSVDTK